MRHASRWLSLWVVLALALLTPAIACAKDGKKQDAAPKQDVPPPPPADPTLAEATRRAEEQARRIREAMAQPNPAPPPVSAAPLIEPTLAPQPLAQPAPTPPPKRPIPKVEWIDPPKPAPAPAPPPVIQPAPVVEAAPATQPAPVAVAPATQPAPESVVAVAPPPVKLDRDALLVRLLDDIRAGKDPALYKAMSAAALSLLDPDRQLDESDLAPLTGPQRDQVERYHQMIVLLSTQLASGQSAGNADEIAERLKQITGNDTLRIRDIQLCRKVSGYGVYEPFDSNTFLAGRDQPMIVYVELENFRSLKDAADQYNVKLTQEIVLYNESDGLAVWKQPGTEIVDQSRNRRRDFFVVQLIRLPARLGVGKYRLKVRINDLNGGSIDETTLPIQFVADKTVLTAR